MVKKFCSWGVLAAVWWLAPVARAESNPGGGTRLSFVRTANASDCIAAPALEREIARRMRRDPFAGPTQQWVEVIVERDSDGYAAHLFERDLEGRTLGARELRSEAADCHQLDDAMVLAVALIIDPTAQLAPASSAEAPAAEDPKSATFSAENSTEPATRAPAVDTRSSGPLREAPIQPREASAPSAFVAADVVLVNGVLPGVAPGAELVTQLPIDTAGRYALRLSALYLPEARQRSSVGDFGFGLSALDAGACRVAPSSRLRWFACAGLGAGATHAVVHDLAPLKPGDRLWLSLRAEAGVAVRVVGPLWLEARLFDLVALRRWEFRVRTETGSEGAFSQAAFMPGAALGVGLHFE